MDGFETMVKAMLGNVNTCDACGCTLTINKTFYRQCFSCDAVLWKDYIREEV